MCTSLEVSPPHSVLFRASTSFLVSLRSDQMKFLLYSDSLWLRLFLRFHVGTVCNSALLLWLCIRYNGECFIIHTAYYTATFFKLNCVTKWCEWEKKFLGIAVLKKYFTRESRNPAWNSDFLVSFITYISVP